jgi:hypothetical protein
MGRPGPMAVTGSRGRRRGGHHRRRHDQHGRRHGLLTSPSQTHAANRPSTHLSRGLPAGRAGGPAAARIIARTGAHPGPLKPEPGTTGGAPPGVSTSISEKRGSRSIPARARGHCRRSRCWTPVGLRQASTSFELPHGSPSPCPSLTAPSWQAGGDGLRKCRSSDVHGRRTFTVVTRSSRPHSQNVVDARYSQPRRVDSTRAVHACAAHH